MIFIEFILAIILFCTISFGAFVYYQTSKVIGKWFNVFTIFYIILDIFLLIAVFEEYALLMTLTFIFICFPIVYFVCGKMYEDIFKDVNEYLKKY